MNTLRKHDLTRETPALDEAVKDEFNCNLNNAAGTRLLKTRRQGIVCSEI